METMKAIAGRQSCRAYTGEQITDEELQVLLKAANAAPVSMGKFDEVKITVIQNTEILAKLDAIGAAFFGNPEIHPLYGASTVILVSGASAESMQNISAYCNGSAIVENMALAATELGLGSVYLLGAILALAKNPELYAEFKIPDGFFPVAALAVGKAAMPLKEKELTVSKIATDIVK